MLTLLTPTGSRPEAFALCEQWIAAQRDAPWSRWIVVDDGDIPTPVTMGQHVIRRQPDGKADPPHTLSLNLRTAIAHIGTLGADDRLCIIEDDDYYGPDYLRTVTDWLDCHEVVGESGSKYWHIGLRGYKRVKARIYAALCRTSIKGPAAFDALRCAAADDHWSVDKRLWQNWAGSRLLWFDRAGDSHLHVGIKGMPGRVSPLHAVQEYTPDPDYAMLRHWCGDAWRIYADICERTESPCLT